jgi:dienelactone hydrolase
MRLAPRAPDGSACSASASAGCTATRPRGAPGSPRSSASTWRSPTQGEPLDYLAHGHADRDLAIIGGKDEYTPPRDVTALAATGVTVVQYPDAEHGFAHDPTRPAHRPDDAADAFTRARAWLTSP